MRNCTLTNLITLVSFGLLICASCAKGEANPSHDAGTVGEVSGDAPAPPEVDQCDETTVSQGTIGPDGGEIFSSDDSVRIRFPSGSLSQNTLVKLDTCPGGPTETTDVSYEENSEDINVIYSETIVVDYTTVCDIIVRHLFALGATYTDPTTGYIWQNRPEQIINPTFYHYEAIDYCNELYWGGRADWRLPTVGELRSLIRGCPATVTGGECNVTDDCTLSECAWKDQEGDPCKGCHPRRGPGNAGIYFPEELLLEYGIYWTSTDSQGGTWAISAEMGSIRL